MAQIRRAKLRCTCHGAIFERVLVRRTQEYKSIPRTTSRKSPEIAHVRRHGSLPCMPLFSPREPRFRRRVRGSRGVFSRHMSGKRRIFILTKRQQTKPVFSSCCYFNLFYNRKIVFQYKKALHLPPYGTMQRFYYSQSIIHDDFPCVFVKRRNFHSYGVNR